jgi:hypothetical protein
MITTSIFDQLNLPALASPLAERLCGEPFFSGEPFFLEGRRAEIPASSEASGDCKTEANRSPRPLPGRKVHSVQPLDLQRTEERFGHGVVQQSPFRLIEPFMPKATSCFWKTHLAADRTSCTNALANQFRLFLHAGAYWLMWGPARIYAQALNVARRAVRHVAPSAHQSRRSR